MKKFFKRITGALLASLLILTCIPNYVENAVAVPETIKEVHITSDQQYGIVAEGDSYFPVNFSNENYTVTSFGQNSGDNFLYNEVTFETKPDSGAILGNTYYTRIAIIPQGTYNLDSNLEIYLGDLKLGPDHPCYVSEPEPYEAENGIFVTLKCKCMTNSELLIPTLNLPAYGPSLTPNDYVELCDEGEAKIWWTLPKGDGTDDDVLAESKITSLEFYNDKDCTEGEKIAPTENLGYNDYYIKAGFKISEIVEEIGVETYQKLFPNYADPSNDTGLYITNMYYNVNDGISSVMMRNSDLSVVVSSAYSIQSWSFNSDDAYVVFHEKGTYPRIDKVECTNVTEHEMDITFYGANMPFAFEGGLMKEDFTSVSHAMYTSGVCFDVNASRTVGTFHLEITKTGGEYIHDIKPNETFRLYLEGWYDNGDEYNLENGVTIVKEITPIVQTPTRTKKYTAQNVNTSAEKISGSGSKGSKRTITPKEGKKVQSVSVTDKNGNKIDVTMNADGTYSFIQPASSVNVEVIYVNREIKLTIGSTEASVDGEVSNLDVCPITRNDRTMLPIRFVAENLGAKVDWDEKNPNTVLITKGDIKIEITLGSDIAKVNGKEYKLDAVAFAENDRTYLPVRFVSENLNAIVEWNEQRPMEVKIYER